MSLRVMSTTFGLLLALTTSSAAQPSASPAQPPWIRDLDAGKKAAQAAGKDLIVVFTGHGWCLNCDILDREVFQQAAFIEEAGKSHVFVELDLVLGESAEDKAREKKFREWQKDYLINGVPTVVLVDSDGRPYAFMTGHAPGNGPLTALAMLRMAQIAKKQRDEHFRAARIAGPADRARYLHQGIQSVGWLLGSTQERGDDPVLAFYKDRVAEIEKEDAVGNFRDLYAKRRVERDAWVAADSVFSRLKKFSETKDNRGAIEFIQFTLPTVKDRETRWRLEIARKTYLEWDGQYAEALSTVRRLYDFPGLRADERLYLQRREAFNLFNLKRIDEGIELYDRMISDARDDPKARLKEQWWKAQMLNSHGTHEQAIAAWREYRDADQRGSDRWKTATSLLAYKLRAQTKHREAIVLIHELLDMDKNKSPKSDLAWTMVDAAESHVALGENEKAAVLIHEAEAAIEPTRKSERKMEKDVAARIQKRIDGLREQMTAMPRHPS